MLFETAINPRLLETCCFLAGAQSTAELQFMFYKFFCMTTPSRCSLTNWSWGRSGASWWHLEVPYGFKNFFTYIKSYMSYNLCFINFFVWPTLIGAAILKKPKNRISGSGWTGTGLKKKITYIKPYKSFDWCSGKLCDEKNDQRSVWVTIIIFSKKRTILSVKACF